MKEYLVGGLSPLTPYQIASAACEIAKAAHGNYDWEPYAKRIIGLVEEAVRRAGGS